MTWHTCGVGKLVLVSWVQPCVMVSQLSLSVPKPAVMLRAPDGELLWATHPVQPLHEWLF